MSKTIHIVMQGKGGVGKSVVARLIAEYMIEKERSYAAFDADPVNQTFGALTGFGVEIVDLVKAGNVDAARFDGLVEKAMASETEAVIIDTGAAAFLPLLRYIEDTALPELLAENGHELFFHTVVTGGPSFDDTFEGFARMSERFGDDANVIAWVNSYFGDVENEGTAFSDMKDVKDLIKREKLAGIIMIPEMSDLPRADFSAFLKRDTPFARIKDDTDVSLMARSRLQKLSRQFFEAMDSVLGDVDDA